MMNIRKYDLYADQAEVFAGLQYMVKKFRRNYLQSSCYPKLIYTAGDNQSREVYLYWHTDEISNKYSLEFYWGNCSTNNSQECVRLIKGLRWEVEDYLHRINLPDILLNNLLHWEDLHT